MQDRQHTLGHYLSGFVKRQQAGDPAGALRAVESALAAAVADEASGEVIAALLLRSARAAYHLSSFDESLDFLDRFEHAANGFDGHFAPFRFEAALVRANILRRRGDYIGALALLGEPLDPHAGGIPCELAGERLLIEGACHYYLHDSIKAREVLETALGLCAGEQGRRLRSRVLVMMGLVMQRLGFLRKAADDFTRAAELCDWDGDRYGSAAARLNLGIALYHEGRLEAAARAVGEAERAFRGIGWKIGRCRCRIASGNILIRGGDHDRALECYSDAARTARRYRFRREETLAMSALGAVHIERGDHRRAARCLEAAAGIAAEIAPDGDLAAEVLVRRAELEIARGHPAGAGPFLETAEKIAIGISGVLEQGLVQRARGLAAFADGSADEGRGRFTEACRLVRDSGCEYELAQTLVLFAEALAGGVHAGDPRQVRADHAAREISLLALEARHLFSGMGIKSWCDRAERHLSAPALSGGIAAPATTAAAECGCVEICFSPQFVISDGFIGISPLMHEVWNRIRFAASFEGTVCVTGETGTGKELVARLIHQSSRRAQGPFVAVNCAAIPDHLFESEFFGHRRGSFTGALTDRRGFFEEAHGGTLFLDEVGELSALQQAKLLRVLQEAAIRRVGENVERRIDIKVVSATNRDLEERLNEKSMRSDFYFRISAERIHVPPLRERSEDIIPLLAWRLSGNCGGGMAVLVERDVIVKLQRYPWPGNVREFFSVIDRLGRVAAGGTLAAGMLPEHLAGGSFAPAAAAAARESTSRQRLERAMNVCGGNKSAAARMLGISRGTLYKELKKCGLDKHFGGRQAPAGPR